MRLRYTAPPSCQVEGPLSSPVRRHHYGHLPDESRGLPPTHPEKEYFSQVPTSMGLPAQASTRNGASADGTRLHPFVYSDTGILSMFLHFHLHSERCGWRIPIHAAKGVWYKPRQCFCHR